MDKPRALLLVHRGSRSVERLTAMVREKGFEPLVLSSALNDGDDYFVAKCAELGVPCHVSARTQLELPDVHEALGEQRHNCRFALGFWDGQRTLMAEANELLGAADISARAAALIQDKLAVRLRLQAAGLTTLSAFRLNEDARTRLAGGKRHIVRPRRGAGSLLTALVSSWAEAEALEARFRVGTGQDDLFGEFFTHNELFAEEFFAGREFSLDVVRSAGRTHFTCWHEKTRLEFSSTTILERGFASPCVTLDRAACAEGLAFTERVLGALDMQAGCFHVELLRDERGIWELIEVNPRPGGGLIAESVRQQYGRRMTSDWIDVLSRAPLAKVPDEPACGTYLQFAYPQSGRTIARVVRAADMAEPQVFSALLEPGKAARHDREDPGAMVLWRTALSSHRDEVSALSAREYVSFEYVA
jgi:hypothetical protein